MTKNSTANERTPQTSSGTDGAMGFLDWAVSAAAASNAVANIAGCLGELQQDEDDEPDQGERLGERDTEEHRRAGHTCGLGLAGHGSDGVPDDDADADARPDGSRAIADTGA